MADFFSEEDVDLPSKSQKIIDICNYVINRCWDKIYDKDSNPDAMEEDDLFKVLRLTGESYAIILDIYLLGKEKDNIDENDQEDWK